MPSVNEGLKQEASPGEQYEQARQEIHASGEEIAESMLSDEGNLSTDIKSGLTFEDGSTTEREQVHRRYEALQRDPSFQENLRRGHELNQREAAERVELEAYRKERQADAALDSLEDSDDVVTRAEAWSGLTTEDRMRAVELGLVEADEVEQLAYVASQMVKSGAEQAAATATVQAAKLLAHQEEQLTRQHFSGRGLAVDDANTRILGMNNLAKEKYNLDLSLVLAQHGAEAYRESLSRFEAEFLEDERAMRTRMFHERLVNEPSTDISAGITQLTAFGHMPVQDRYLPSSYSSEDEYAARVYETANALHGRRPGRESAAEIVQAMTEGTSFEAGLTDKNGRRVSVDDATGSRERWEREKREARANTMGLR
jgi:hypothetical protein